MNRKAIALLSLIGLFVSIYLLMFHLGMIGSLACGVDGGCHTVQTSRWASFLGLPVPLWGTLGYGVLFGVALLGAADGRQDSTRLSLLLLGLATGAFAFSLYLTALEAFVIHAWCRWCVVSAILSTLIFVSALGELPRLRRGGRATEYALHE